MNITKFTAEVGYWLREYWEVERLHGRAPSAQGFADIVREMGEAEVKRFPADFPKKPYEKRFCACGCGEVRRV
jgi:hypothetical protein